MSDTPVKVPTVEEIELGAYEIYLKRGDAEGIALEEWLAAEKELLASRQVDAIDSLVKCEGCILTFGDARSLDSEAVSEFHLLCISLRTVGNTFGISASISSRR